MTKFDYIKEFEKFLATENVGDRFGFLVDWVYRTDVATYLKSKLPVEYIDHAINPLDGDGSNKEYDFWEPISKIWKQHLANINRVIEYLSINCPTKDMEPKTRARRRAMDADRIANSVALYWYCRDLLEARTKKQRTRGAFFMSHHFDTSLSSSELSIWKNGKHAIDGVNKIYAIHKATGLSCDFIINALMNGLPNEG